MYKGNLTREQAIEQVGLAAVMAVEAENCDFTNRVDADLDCNDEVEFAASVSLNDEYGSHLIAYYYQTQDALDDAGDDLSNCDWEIAGYEII